MTEQFNKAQSNHDHSEDPAYWEKEKRELFDSIPAVYEKSDIMETWSIKMMMVKLHKTGVYTIDLGEFSGSGQTKDEALKDLCEQIAGDESCQNQATQPA